MNWKLTAALAGAALFAAAGTAHAEGELNIYNWGNYTSPEMIKKFEEAYKVKVTVTDYDSNDTALAKVRAGGYFKQRYREFYDYTSDETIPAELPGPAAGSDEGRDS